MDLVCKLCNGMSRVQHRCSFCGSEMQDGGVINNYYGPYSPYETMDIMPDTHITTNDGVKCVHLLICPVCGADTRVGIDLERM